MSVRIEPVDTTRVAEATLRNLHALYLEWDSEDRPDDPAVPWEQRLVDWRNLREFEEVPRWVAWVDDEIVGATGLYLNKTQDLDNAWTWMFVRADQRRRGVAKILARESISYAIANGRKRLGLGVLQGSEYRELPPRAGMHPVYNERVSQLRVADLDHALMRSWIERASERAADYEVLFLPMPVPAEHRPNFIAISEVMNTAPMEDMEEDPIHWDDAMLASVEEMEARKKRQIHTCVARHKPSGDFAGYTTLVYQSLHPQHAHQWDTGVDPKHRNKGLGRWVKAALVEAFLAEHPDVEIIETQNADSNEPMLNINVAMGFKPARTFDLFQGPVEDVAEYLGL